MTEKGPSQSEYAALRDQHLAEMEEYLAGTRSSHNQMLSGDPERASWDLACRDVADSARVQALAAAAHVYATLSAL